ncbi:MAG: hypothetical protein ACRD1Z_04805 [Vicinamibacteria bacterium]
MNHYLKVKGGDSVLVDLGGYGIVAHLDLGKEFYDVDYVKISYLDGEPAPENLAADMVVYQWPRGRSLVKQANSVRIWRHKAK